MGPTHLVELARHSLNVSSEGLEVVKGFLGADIARDEDRVDLARELDDEQMKSKFGIWIRREEP